MPIGAILPLRARGSYDVDDLNRAAILFRTLRAFAEPGLIDPLLIAVPEDEVGTVSDAFGGARWSGLNIEIMTEHALVPELARYPDMRGWRKQQIIKLAAARVIEREFFLTLDADVVCLKRLRYDDLVIDGRALLQLEARANHPRWWRSSARILDMSPDTGDASVGMHVTPAVLSREICLGLAEELSGNRRGSWVDLLGWLHKPRHPSNWLPERFRRARWTEYSLYYLFALKHGLLERYHVIAGSEPAPDLLSVGCKRDFDQWDTAGSFSADGPSLFCLVGSKTGVEPGVVWNHIRPFVPE